MTRNIILFTLFSVLIISSLLDSQEMVDVRFELTESKNVATPIRNWLFPDEASIISIDNEQITWQGDPRGRYLTLPTDLVKIVFSKSGSYLGIVRLDVTSLPTRNRTETRTLQIRVFTANLDYLYTIERPYEYDDALPLTAITDRDGSLILGQNPTGEVRFYNPEGSLLRTVRLFDDAEYDLERVLQIDISKDGTTAAIVAGKRGASPSGSNAPHPSAEPHLFLFSLNGEELFRKPLPDFNTSAVAISDNGQYIAANSYTVSTDGNITRRTLVFDHTGKEIGRMNFLFKRAAFSPDSKFLLLADNTVAKAFNLTTGDTSWSYTIPKRDGIIAAVDVSNNGEISALLVAKSKFESGAFIFTNPRVKILNRGGSILQELEMVDQEFETPALKVSEDSKKIFIGFRNAYQIYKVK